MVKLLVKKEKRFANDRIIVTDFKKLKKNEFPQCKDGHMFFVHYDGKIYLDSNEKANEPIISTLKILSQYPKSVLRKWEKKRKILYPDINTAEDLEKLKGNDKDFMKALSMLLVPVEIRSRETEKAYYG